MTIVRNLRSTKARRFWASAERDAAEVAAWPAWKRAGINVEQLQPARRKRAKGKSGGRS